MIRRRFPIQFFGAVLLLCLMLSGSGCRLSYLFHVAKGQIQLLNGAMPISEALNSQPFTPAQREKLVLVPQIKAFGEKALGLKKTTNYETVYPRSDQNPIYIVSASAKDHFSRKTWWFPIVGNMPYLGFFDLEKAKNERKLLLDEGLDVFVGKAGAYSTLGWFQDPVPMNLIEGNTPQLVETLLHEMTHATLYVNGQGTFNEGLAVLVGKVGAFQFFEKFFGTEHPFTRQAQNALADERLFSRFLNALMLDLERLYKRDMAYEEKLVRREQVFAGYRNRFQGLKADLKTRQFVHFGQAPLNNAYLLTVALYHRHFELFEAALKKENGSIRGMMLFFEGFSQQDGDFIERLRKVVNDSNSNFETIISVGAVSSPEKSVARRRSHSAVQVKRITLLSEDHWDKSILDEIGYDGSHKVNLHAQGFGFFSGSFAVGDEFTGDGLLPGADFPGQFSDLLIFHQQTLGRTEKNDFDLVHPPLFEGFVGVHQSGYRLFLI